MQRGSKQARKPYWLGTEVRGVLKELTECLKPMQGESDIQSWISNLRPECRGKKRKWVRDQKEKGESETFI